MDIPFEFVSLILTPLLTAVGTLFVFLNREKTGRLEDCRKSIEERDRRITRLESIVSDYRDRSLPALDSVNSTLKRLTDLYEDQNVSSRRSNGERR